jgi:uncharacterized Zn-finger protein
VASESASSKEVQAEALIRPNASNHYQVDSSDLPLSCPMPGMYLWNSHPRVYLPIENSGSAKCPYCSASYELVDNDQSGIARQAS